jgi:hypothetical protein
VAHVGGARSPSTPISRPESTGPYLPFLMLQIYVSSVSDISDICCSVCMYVAKGDQDVCICCKCFRGMLQVFFNVLSVSDVCCKRFLRGCCICFTHMLQKYVPNVSVVSFLCCVSVFMLQVTSILSRCCMCFIHMLLVYVPNVLSASDVCYIKYFMLQAFRVSESWGHSPGAGGRGAVNRGPANGGRDVPRGLRTGVLVLIPVPRSCPHRGLRTGVLVLIPVPRSCPHRERQRGGG